MCLWYILPWLVSAYTWRQAYIYHQLAASGGAHRTAEWRRSERLELHLEAGMALTLDDIFNLVSGSMSRIRVVHLGILRCLKELYLGGIAYQNTLQVVAGCL